MSDKSRLCKAIIEQGALREADLAAELVEADEDGATWRVCLKRAVSFLWGGVERTLPAGVALGEVDTYPEYGETAEDVPYLFINRPEQYIYPVERLEREMTDAD